MASVRGRGWPRWAFAHALPVALAGCSLPVPGTGHDLVLGYVCVDDVEHRARRVTPGLDVSLRGPRPDVTLGWSDVCWASTSSGWHASPAPADGYRAPLGWQWTDGTRRHALGWLLDEPPVLRAGSDAPCFVQHAFVGLDVAFSEHARGLSLGLGRTSLLVVPEQADGVFRLTMPAGDATRVRLDPLEFPGEDP